MEKVYGLIFLKQKKDVPNEPGGVEGYLKFGFSIYQTKTIKCFRILKDLFVTHFLFQVVEFIAVLP